MIIDFSISNFRSIREKQTLSFEATEDEHLEDYFVVKEGKYRLLKIATILGANASGKSNVLKAFYLFRQLMIRPCKDKTSTIKYDKFALDKECEKLHTELSVNFIVGENKYFYESEFDNKVVYREILKCQPFDALRDHTVYERFTDETTWVSSIKWGEKYRSANVTRILLGNLLHNRTLFGAYLNSNVNLQWMKNILDWLQDYFMPTVTTDDQKIKNYISRCILDEKIDKDSLVTQIMKADVGINDIDIEQRKEPIDSDLLDFILHDDTAPQKLKDKLQADPNNDIIDIRLKHKGHQDAVSFDFDDESGGTQRYYELSGLLLKIIKESHFVAIDELECRLHPDLYQHFIITYLTNAKKSQMVFSSHMREFLKDRNLFRDDSVWITEKSESGDTDLYSLADFDTSTLREVSSRYNAYCTGKLGGIPNLGDNYVSFPNDDK